MPNDEANILYGVSFPKSWDRFMCEIYLFLHSPKFEIDPYWRPNGAVDTNPSAQPYSGEGRFQHAQNLGMLLFPKSFEWQDFSIAAMQSFCRPEHSAVTGGGGTSKSNTAALFALLWLLVAPDDSAVLIASTTVDAAKKRIWKPLRQYYTELVRMFRQVGNTVLIGNPRPCIRSSPQDSAHGIYVVAVAKGEVDKGVESLKGFHPKRLLMIGDETDAISQAVVDVEVNQQIGTLEYKQIWLGNDPSMFNPLGKLMEPEPGKVVTLAHKEWTSTKGVHCLRFDAYDSPNLRDKDKWSGIVRQKDIDIAIKNYGGENSPQFYIMMRGIHPPEGADNTVMSEALLLRHNCRSTDFVWLSGFVLSGMLDPAFGGDSCIFRTFKRGIDTSGKMRILLDEIIPIRINVTDKTTPPEYQIANQVKALCASRSIPPEEFIGDATGTGRGALSVLKVEWSPLINECQFGGTPSAMPVSEENPIPANEEYDRKVTELWFSFREFVKSDMIRGLDAQTAIEFCQRRFEVKNRKTSIEKKEDMKARGLPSPDNADALVAGIHMLREKGVDAKIVSPVKQVATVNWDKYLREQDLDAGADNYSPDGAGAFAGVY